MRGPKRWMANKSATPWVKIPSEGCKGEITLSSAVISVYFLGAKSREQSRPSNVIRVQRAAAAKRKGSTASVGCGARSLHVEMRSPQGSSDGHSPRSLSDVILSPMSPSQLERRGTREDSAVSLRRTGSLPSLPSRLTRRLALPRLPSLPSRPS